MLKCSKGFNAKWGVHSCYSGDRWYPPPQGFIKLNWDTAVNGPDGWIGLGIVARDCLGRFMGARRILFQLQVAPKMAETIAAYYAV
jgi:hypothetical protein